MAIALAGPHSSAAYPRGAGLRARGLQAPGQRSHCRAIDDGPFYDGLRSRRCEAFRAAGPTDRGDAASHAAGDRGTLAAEPGHTEIVLAATRPWHSDRLLDFGEGR